MPCIVGTDSGGNRFIACRRGEDMPRRSMRAFISDDDGMRYAKSPWRAGAIVHHQKYGRGTIIDRNDMAISVRFDSKANGPPTAFMLAYVGKMMTVEGASDA